ncbi:MAG TPA: carboxylesterase family protein [Caulobacteraceae bacterium]|jgi:para-nitrobenzyl esterase
MAKDDDGAALGRRQVLGLSLGVAAAVGLAQESPAAAQTPAASPATGLMESGPGLPIPTAVVQTHSGPVQGLVVDGVQSFKGLRYGAAPIGPLRWKPPQSPKPWTSPYDASDFGAPAMQLAGGATVDASNAFGFQMHRVFTTPSELKVMNEDCLYLNVWSPGLESKKRPVMVWVHGGGYAYGSGSQPIYQGDGLAKAGDVVVVSVNHRLNVFGYLHLGDLMGPDYASSGTVGMQDLVLALQWVRDNIEAFGGDPGNVMIMGQSGGGAKVSTLLAMPSAKGLFHRAAIQSGPGLNVGRKPAATEAAKKLLDELNVKPGDIAALQALPAQTILDAALKLNHGAPGGVGGGPVLDEVVITRDPFTPDAPDASADVPILVGWCKDEWTIFTAGEPWFGHMTEEDLQTRVKPFGEPGQRLLAAYRKAYPSYSPTYLWEQMISARVMLGSEILAARKAAKGGAPAYVYMVTWETPVEGGVFKTPHTMEIPFMLYSYDKVRTYVGPGPGPKHMADQIGGAWVAFARHGVPDHPGIPHWPAFNVSERPVMVFNTRSEVVKDPLPEVRQVLETLPQALMLRG